MHLGAASPSTRAEHAIRRPGSRLDSTVLRPQPRDVVREQADQQTTYKQEVDVGEKDVASA